MSTLKRSGVFASRIVVLLGFICCVPLAWSHGAEDRHSDRVERIIAPDDSFELCLVLERDQKLDYSFSAPRMLDFNIHYHVDQKVIYPVSEGQIMNATDTFMAQSEQEYCLMWTNQGGADVLLSLEYEKPQQ